MANIISWVSANWGVVATVLLGISEALALLFPSKTGFGGILSGFVSFLKSVGAKPPTIS